MVTKSLTDNDLFNSAVGITAGYSTYKIVPPFIVRPYGKMFLKTVKSMSETENDTFYKAALKACQEPGLNKKGITIVELDENNVEKEIENYLAKRKEKNATTPIEKFFEKRRVNKIEKKFKTIAKGKNASYMTFTKQVLINKNKMPFAAFHELGHGMNFNDNGVRKFLTHARHLSLLAPIALLIGLFKRTPKNENGKSENGVGDFIKKHCGLIAGFSMVPIVIEEGVASLNGQKLAKESKMLDNISYKKLVKLNTGAWGTYVIRAVLTGIFAQLAVYIKDKIVGDK